MNKSILLARFLTEPTIRVLAGDRYYRRGLDYFQRGHVVSIEAWDNTIQAVVRGTESYTVEITAKSDRLDFECDCPVGGDGEFCKHCVAAALAWRDREAADPGGGTMAGAGGKARQRTKSEIAPQTTTKEIARVLGSTDKAALIDLVLEWSEQEPGLRAKLTEYAGFAMGPEAAVRQTRLSLEKAIRIRRSVPYQEAGGYAGGVNSAIDSRKAHRERPRLAGNRAMRGVAAMAGHGYREHRRFRRAGYRVDGAASGNSFARLRVGEARPHRTGRALVSRRVACAVRRISGSAEKYAGILGAEGLQAFRKLAEAEWAKATVRVPGERSGERRDDFSITAIMISLARQSGDVEQLVSILERDLGGPCRYLQISEVYRGAGDADRALDWAEKGVAAFPDRPDRRLRLFLAEEYRRCDRHQDALRTVWLEFLDHPSLDNYKFLEEFAR